MRQEGSDLCPTSEDDVFVVNPRSTQAFYNNPPEDTTFLRLDTDVAEQRKCPPPASLPAFSTNIVEVVDEIQRWAADLNLDSGAHGVIKKELQGPRRTKGKGCRLGTHGCMAKILCDHSGKAPLKDINSLACMHAPSKHTNCPWFIQLKEV